MPARRIVIAALAAMLLGGCSTGADPSAPVPSIAPSSPRTVPSPSEVAVPESAPPATLRPDPTPSPVPPSAVPPLAPPSPSPAPTQAGEPPDDLPLLARAERDGIVVRIELQRNPMPAGEPSWVKTSVRNAGNTPVTWFHDGCATPVSVWAEMPGTFDAGVEHEGIAGEFKERLMGTYLSDPEPDLSLLWFGTRAELNGGSIGCADVGLTELIPPGEAIEATRWWPGFVAAKRGPPIGGATTLEAAADDYGRDGSRPRGRNKAPIRVEVPLWISDGVSPERPSPPEIVDVALHDLGFAAFLETQDLGNGRDELLWYDADHDAWEVGVLAWHDDEEPWIRGVVVDATRGAVIGPLDRAWDEERDGFP